MSPNPLRITGKIVKPTKRHVALRADIEKILDKYREMPAGELLGIASQIVGMMIAYMPAETVSPAFATSVVSHNIEIGNAAVLALIAEQQAKLLDTPAAGNG